jgi:hypothetical protein
LKLKSCLKHAVETIYSSIHIRGLENAAGLNSKYLLCISIWCGLIYFDGGGMGK